MMNDRDCCQKFAAFVVVVVVYVHSTTPQQSYQKRGQVKRSAGKSSRKKIQYRIFFFFHLCTSSDGHQCLGPVSFRSVTSSPDTNKKKIRPKSAMNGTQKRNEARDGGLCEREKKENTSCSHARKIANSNRLRFLLLSTFQNPIDESWRSRTRVLCVPMYMYRVFMLTQA